MVIEGRREAEPIGSSNATMAAAYADLRRTFLDARLLEPAYGYYLCRGLFTFALLVIAVVIPFSLPPLLGWSMIAAVLMGFAKVQVGLIGHDAGHMAICRGAPANRALGQLCWSISLAIGFSYWNNRHMRHHTYTNDSDKDPDLAGLGLLAYAEQQVAMRRGWRRAVVRYQAFLSAFLLLFLAFGFRIESWIFTLRRLRGGRRLVEVVLLTTGTVLWITPAYFLGWRWVAVYLGSQLVASVYMSFVIAPNHYGMPTWPRDAQLSFLERQVLSSRNVSARPLWDFVFGGLNYQIEHHLFPTMPRVRFRRAQAIVRPFCAAHGLSYEEADPFHAYTQVFAAGHRVGRSTPRVG